MKSVPKLPNVCRSQRWLALLLSLGFLSTAAYAEPQQGPNGNYYDVVLVPEHITWPQAKLAAEQRSYFGRPGHLATLTSAEEDVFAEHLRQLTPPEGGVHQLWVGGYQVPGSPEASEGWMWINDEGPIAGFHGADTYTNWQSFQPDNAWGGEDYLAIGLYGLFGWNDDGSYGDNRFDGTLDGYLVEYEALTVGIDIKPGSATNPVNLDAPGKLPVAILSTTTFDAATINRSSLTFGTTGIEARLLSATLADVNGDKRKDLICEFSTLEAGFLCGDTAGVLRGRTTGGTPIRGSDVVQTKNCPPYDLSLLALQDVNHLTDLYLKANVTAPGFTPPLLAKTIVLKSLDISGQPHWSKIFQNTALTPEGTTSSSVNLQFTDLTRHQTVNAQMTVPAGKAGATYVLRSEALVLARPDLSVERIDAPSEGFVRQVVNIPVYLKELNGDLGATATVTLMEGNTVIDTAPAVSFPAGASVAVVFSATFSSQGTHPLKVVVGEVTPGDYDPSNNEGTGTIDIVTPDLETVGYFLHYSWTGYESFNQTTTPEWISVQTENGKYESFIQDLYLPFGLQFPITSVRLEARADGKPPVEFEVTNLQADSSWGDETGWSQGVFLEFERNSYLYVSSYGGSCCGPGNTFVNVSRYPADYVTFSSFHDLIHGEAQEYSGGESFGTFLDATEQVDTRFIVTHPEGTFGGNASVSLFSQPFNDVWDYGDSSYRSQGYYRGTNVWGDSSGQTTQ